MATIMGSDDRIRQLEAEVKRLKDKEKKLEHDLSIYKQIFAHLRTQFEHMKHELLKR